MIQWALGDRADAKPSIKGLDRTQLRLYADSAFKASTAYAPDSARYQLMMGRFLLSSGASGARP